MTNTQNDEISAFLAQWTAAEQNGDSAALELALAEDFSGVGPLGFELSRRDWLERHANADLTYDRFELDEVRIRTYGDAAVVIAHQRGEGNYRGNPLPGHLRATLVVVRRPDGWRLAAIQMSFMAGTPGAPAIPGQGNAR
jgi:ketosteroid isomerase-like protein